MFFILIFLPKAISFHIWRLKCVCIFILFTKKVGQSVQIFGLYGFVKSDLYEMAFRSPDLPGLKYSSLESRLRIKSSLFFHQKSAQLVASKSMSSLVLYPIRYGCLSFIRKTYNYMV